MKLSAVNLISALAALLGVGSAQSLLMVPLNAANGQSGNMFDVVAATPIVVNGLDINIDQGNWTVSVYAITGGGTFLGAHQNASAWTLLGTTPVVGLGLNVPTPLPLALSLAVNPGTPQGIYVSSAAAGQPAMNYTTGAAGTLQSILADDGVLSVTCGIGNSFPLFGGYLPFGTLTPGVSQSRKFSGRIYYTPAGPPNNGLGQAPQSGSAVLNVNDARDVDNFRVSLGGNGPYSVNVASGNNMAFRFGGAANQPIIFLAGPLNVASQNFPGVGQLDIGTPNGGIPTDIQVLADGASLSGFLPEFFVLDGTGNRTITLASGAAAGLTLTFQCAMLTGGPTVIALSNAVTVNIL